MHCLSDRERQVVELAAQGLGDKQIAKALRVSSWTVRTYWDRLREKTGGLNRLHVVVLALDLDESHARPIDADQRERKQADLR